MIRRRRAPREQIRGVPVVSPFGEQAELCRHSPCVVCGRGPSDPHHEPPRGRDGRGDDADTVPLCRRHHDERHAIGRRAFDERHGVSLLEYVKATRARLAAIKAADLAPNGVP